MLGPVLYALFWVGSPWLLFFSVFLYFEQFPVFSPPAKKPSAALTPRRKQKVLCTSWNCVRCAKNETLLESAKQALESTKNGSEDLKRIEDALERKDEDLLLKLEFPVEAPIWDLNDVPDTFRTDFDMLANALEAVKEDCQKAFDCPSMWSRNGLGENTWFIFPFLNQGVWQDEHCSVCPRIASILYRLRHSISDCVFGNAFISMIPSDCEIAEHCGLTNARLRCHLGVEVPEDSEHCYMKVGDKKFTWTNGECILIDDSLLHSVSLKGCPDDRTVLVVDFWQPLLSEQERLCLKTIFSTSNNG
ncbi:hypothetical protein L596_019530 [Steinernema carpocapsae]|uniref:Aspartyl/asparaginy/proline hydroxylase domain-containing protein n=1 Tax=Steinernema carpocapsae TaxID=34508 RepID=A0A4V6A0L7_STECR|nr:hypothetical protein L596_019530 [Steinernema carpocapsae]